MMMVVVVITEILTHQLTTLVYSSEEVLSFNLLDLH